MVLTTSSSTSSNFQNTFKLDNLFIKLYATLFQSYQEMYCPHLKSLQGTVCYTRVQCIHIRYSWNIWKVIAFINHIPNRCKFETSGKPASYIPQLARGDPNKWGVSLCTIDGQRFSIGDVTDNFTIQSTRYSVVC